MCVCIYIYVYIHIYIYVREKKDCLPNGIDCELYCTALSALLYAVDAFKDCGILHLYMLKSSLHNSNQRDVTNNNFHLKTL